ncbi:MAG: DUF3604 domain-containing protein [Deltaproteobacteria bacterium]|nr:DUF3604 domain-containing protein [Deltaproteobacteria bacterium]
MAGLLLAAAFSLLAGCSDVDDPSLHPVSDPRYDAPAPALRSEAYDPQRSVFWGDLHIHTSLSYDAYTFGVRALPDDAYTFAKGGTIQHAIGYPIRLSRPLDFAAVTDHAEFLGVARAMGEADPTGPVRLRDVLATGSPWRITYNYLRTTLSKMAGSETRKAAFGGGGYSSATNSAWREILASAERHNQPGRFTAFVGYEWTSMPQEYNLHRNVIYRSGQAPELPYTSLDSENPEDLWRALEEQRGQGMEMIAIPHNGNVSNGLMYDRVTFEGAPLGADYAALRMKNEPISEILQVKGQSETHPLLSSEDEFAAFELFDRVMSPSAEFSEPRGSYARDALKSGLEMSQRDGFNPYRFGVIGSSDGHNASAPVEEDRYHGKLPLIDGTVGLRLGESLLIPQAQNRGSRWSAMGLAAVWAEENTRASLFDAMRRKETYATSGPRIQVRFFGGWDFDRSTLADPAVIEKAYAAGVSMGGTLPVRPGGEAPRFVVMALRDPAGANLDRVQIIKAWVDTSGGAHEKIYDIAASGGRRPDPSTHRVGPVGNTVDVEAATYANTIGSAQLRALWSDPDFDAAREAFYYARVLEIPTPRWSTYDARRMGIAAPEPTSLQERAITSAIWYQPATGE